MSEEQKQQVEQDPPVQSQPAEKLYDILIPPGVPRKILVDVVRNFDVELVKREQKMSFANMEGDERELLAFRGRREVIEEVEKFMMGELRKFIDEK